MAVALNALITYLVSLLLLVCHVPFFSDLMEKPQEPSAEPEAYVQTVTGIDEV